MNDAKGSSRPSETAYSNVNGREPLSAVPQAPRAKSSWMAASLITISFLIGVAFAIGHDRYNHFLDGRRADGYSVSQEWVARIQTGFAFLVKTALAAAVAAAYTQQMWRNVKSRPVEVGTVDTVMAAPNDLLSQIDPRGWFKAPGMLLMGAIIWCIPLAAVVSPGTLTVISSPTSNITSLLVPQLSFDYHTWASLGPTSASSVYWSASAAAQRTGFAGATAGDIVGAPHVYANQSYTLDFRGPAVQCSTANDSVRDTVKSFFIHNYGSGGHYAYLSWVGGDDHGILSNTTLDDSGTWSTLDVTSADAARIFVYSNLGGNGTNPDLANVTECLLHNASYTAAFSTVNGVTTATANVTLGRPLQAYGEVNAGGNMTKAAEIYDAYGYQSLMDVFGKLLVGYAYAQNDGIQVTYSSFQRTVLTFQDLDQTQADLEALFQNMTLSMFSNNDLLLDSSQTAAIPVTVSSYPLTYQYLPRDLWIAYGIAIFVTAVAALIGLRAAWVSGVSYSAGFSTAARVAKYTGLYAVLPENDDGSDPLPKQIETIRFGGPGTAVAAVD